jgi:hypothetical protein
MGSETRKLMKELGRFASKVVVDITVAVTDDLYETTPELTGYAETNWIPTIGASATSPAGSKTSVTREVQLGGLANIRSSYRFPAVVYITNLAAYITDLNEGSSSKAPAGFVQTSIARAVQSAI